MFRHDYIGDNPLRKVDPPKVIKRILPSFTQQQVNNLIEKVIAQNGHGENIWHMKRKSIQCMLSELANRTGIPCNAHAFRRGVSPATYIVKVYLHWI